MIWLRALVAAGLSVLFPGAGHALLRDWLRALAFAGIYFLLVLLLFPTEQIADAASMTEATDIVAAETDRTSQFVLSFLALFAAIDATFRAMGYPPNGRGGAGDESDGPTCPECGKAVDEDLDFCHWCTTRLEPETEDGSAEP